MSTQKYAQINGLTITQDADVYMSDSDTIRDGLVL